MEKKKRKKNGYGKSVYQSLALISQFGINMLVPIVMCSFVGMFLDHTFHTSYWMILLFFVGALAGFRNIYVFAKRVYEQPPESRNEMAPDSGRGSSSGNAENGKKVETTVATEKNPEQGV